MKTEKEIHGVLEKLDAALKHKFGDLIHNTKMRDWHGCQDAASDIRDLKAMVQGLDWVLGAKDAPWD